MTKLNSELGQALRERDESRRLLDSVDQLSADESVTEADRLALKQDYLERLRDADAAIERIRDVLREELRSVQQDLEMVAQDESTLQVRHKVGELDLKQYEKASDNLRAREAALERHKTALQKLLDAKSEADVAGVSVPRVRSAAPARAPKTASTRPAAPGIAGLSGSRLKLVSGALIAVGAIAIVALLVQAGAPGLPSISSPFGSDDGSTADGETAGTTPSEGEMDGAPSGQTDDESAGVATDFEVPIELLGATDVGSLHVELTYDETAVELVSVQAGTLPVGALFAYGTTGGRVSLGLVSESGINGDVTMASLVFRVSAESGGVGSAVFALENVVGHDAFTLTPVGTIPEAGGVELVSLAVTPVVVDFFQGSGG